MVSVFRGSHQSDVGDVNRRTPETIVQLHMSPLRQHETFSKQRLVHKLRTELVFF